MGDWQPKPFHLYLGNGEWRLDVAALGRAAGIGRFKPGLRDRLLCGKAFATIPPPELLQPIPAKV